MKKMISVVVILMCVAVVAQAAAPWLTDFGAAQKVAAEKKLPILALFTGSDWCSWCIKLDKEVLSQKVFCDYASTNLVLFKADFPRKIKIAVDVMKANQALQTKYGVRGYPTVLLLNNDGSLIDTTGYEPGGAAKYVDMLKKMLPSR